MKLGLCPGISEKEYREADALNSSAIKTFLKSPLHYKTYRNIDKQTKAKNFGTALHKAILQPDIFEQTVAIEPVDINKRTKAGREEYAQWVDENNGKMFITSNEYQTLQGMMGAAYANPVIKKTLSKPNAQAEIAAFFEYEGVLCKALYDYLPNNDSNIIIDLKSTTDASYYAFRSSCLKYKYHIQSALYAKGMEVITGRPHTFIFLVIEKFPPFSAIFYTASPEFQAQGENLISSMIHRYAECKQNNIYPGLPLIQNINLT